MESGLNYPNKTGILVFMIGAIIGYLLFLSAFLQDYEALIFSATVSGDETLRSFSCPELITRGETGLVKATITNGTEKRLYRYVRANFSQGYFNLETRDQ